VAMSASVTLHDLGTLLGQGLRFIFLWVTG
jgi:hypothetical protein